jgi:hypothetical protein
MGTSVLGVSTRIRGLCGNSFGVDERPGDQVVGAVRTSWETRSCLSMVGRAGVLGGVGGGHTVSWSARMAPQRVHNWRSPWPSPAGATGRPRRPAQSRSWASPWRRPPRAAVKRDRAAACWLPTAGGLALRRLRHTRRTMTEGRGTEKILTDVRMGAIDNSVSAHYSHVTPAMRQRFRFRLTERWQAALGARLASSPDSRRACSTCSARRAVATS